MPRNLVWKCDSVVSLLAEQSLMESLTQESEDILYRRLIGELSMPVEPSMSEHQIINLLRQVLREKVGEEQFNSMSILGSLDGQKAVADMFERNVETYLRKNELRFSTENELRAMKPKGPRLNHSQVALWKPTSRLDALGRKLFSGPCCLCGVKCECPFKPSVGREGPRCTNCFSYLTPDFLLLDDVYINGQKVKWIDCKCYYGSAGMGIYGRKSLQRVSQDYNEKFGPGAVIFAFGYCESFDALRESGVLLLDGSPLDMTLLDELLYAAPFRQLWRNNNLASTMMTKDVAK